jgi:hypothetical protein
MIECIKASGEFSLLVYEDGELKESYKDANLVVTLGKTAVAKLLAGEVTGRSITKISAGTNGTAPVVGDSAITAPFEKNITGFAYPSANSVRFDFSLESGEANGMSIREFGLITAGGQLFARKVRSEIVKNASVRIVGTWTITIN